MYVLKSCPKLSQLQTTATTLPSQTLKFGRVEGLPDATEFVIYGAASLRTGALSEAGEKISVGCMAKIEMNVQANAMRVTLRSVHPAASQAILQTVKNLLL